MKNNIYKAKQSKRDKTANKSAFLALLIFSAVLLGGCQNEISDASSSLPEESSVVSSDSLAQSDEESSAVFSDSLAQSDEEIETSSEPELGYYAGREYPDDELVPESWIPIDSLADGALKIDETVKADTSVKDPEKAIPALVDKNRLVLEMFFMPFGSDWFNADLNSSYDSPDHDAPLYPVTFSGEDVFDLKQLHDLVYSTYEQSAADDIWNWPNGEPCFVEENGRLYLNAYGTFSRDYKAFRARSYIEITEKSEDKCTFVWHFPDIEKLDVPEAKGFEFSYFDQTYTAEYKDGHWMLNEMIFDLG